MNDEDRVTKNDGSNLAQLEDIMDGVLLHNEAANLRRSASMYRKLGEVASDLQRVTAERDAIAVRVEELLAGNEDRSAALVELASEFRIAGDEWAAVRLETVPGLGAELRALPLEGGE